MRGGWRRGEDRLRVLGYGGGRRSGEMLRSKSRTDGTDRTSRTGRRRGGRGRKSGFGLSVFGFRGKQRWRVGWVDRNGPPDPTRYPRGSGRGGRGRKSGSRVPADGSRFRVPGVGGRGSFKLQAFRVVPCDSVAVLLCWLCVRCSLSACRRRWLTQSRKAAKKKGNTDE